MNSRQASRPTAPPLLLLLWPPFLNPPPLCCVQVVTQTQSGPALVMDLTASPFCEPGALPQCLAALMGLSVTPTDDAAAAAAAAEPTAAAAAGSSGDALAVAALSVLQAAEWKRAEKVIKGLKVRLGVWN